MRVVLGWFRGGAVGGGGGGGSGGGDGAVGGAGLGVDLDTLEASIATREANLPIEVPIMAIYSRCEAVVAWGACVDRSSPHVQHVEVATTHVGLGLSPDVYELVARRLASFR
ncbi:MAG: hypothetical protein M5U14_21730 [Acidimicrobiia bacterium]|nr:hypothetical protein [Acidimicrobiia bacterium]